MSQISTKIAIAHILFGILVIGVCLDFQYSKEFYLDGKWLNALLNFFLFSLPSTESSIYEWFFALLITIPWNLFVFLIYLFLLILSVILLNVLSVLLILLPGIPSILGGILHLLRWKPALKILKVCTYFYVFVFPIGIVFTYWCLHEFEKIQERNSKS
ncbi:MAG TPA: hypothetical protein PK079_05185 [Leptospiraceae bacterium]|nr:hypothetical protein [Leptospiraceae bacterium]HMW06265.1 hypothetical protein [Leptospiraceae bacterium]HMX33174.1 hypothetical protein [Leptospiraceae bacterium]HMY31727.1 hypothetical protein [Leptospiraceae bacterium]HMZ64520.1 hypothetical protein [Leptospiraceae bacterium]